MLLVTAYGDTNKRHFFSQHRCVQASLSDMLTSPVNLKPVRICNMDLRVVVLGAGFGGLELSSMLSEALGDRLDLTLIDKNDSFWGCGFWSSTTLKTKKLLY